MKMIACAAALLLSGTAMAQTAETTTQTEMPAGTQAESTTQATTDMSTGETQATTTTTVTTPTAPAGPVPDIETAGGYEPANPPMSSTPAPGQQVIFQASSLTPDQAYPPPAPLKEYPICKKGQTDNCMQRGGR